MAQDTQRPTKDLTTSGGYKAKIKTYITGRESNSIQDVFMKEASIRDVKMKDGNAEASLGEKGISTNKIWEAQNLTIETMVVRLEYPDGQVFEETSAIREAFLDMPRADFQELLEVIGEITDPKEEGSGT